MLIIFFFSLVTLSFHIANAMERRSRSKEKLYEVTNTVLLLPNITFCARKIPKSLYIDPQYFNLYWDTCKVADTTLAGIASEYLNNQEERYKSEKKRIGSKCRDCKYLWHAAE